MAKEQRAVGDLTDAELEDALLRAQADRDRLKQMLVLLTAERDRRVVASRRLVARHVIETAGVKTSTGVH